MAGTVGLTQQEAARRLEADGPNRLPAASRPSPWLGLARQMTHLFAGLLWAAAALAVLAGMAALGAAIVVVVLLNGIFAFWQEYRADQAAEQLGALVPNRARVLRDGRPRVVPVEDVVVGDAVLLTAGDRVCADLRVADAHALQVDESLLTGESAAVRPPVEALLLCGTFVVEGEGIGVAERTGASTRLAGIAALTRSATRRTSPLTTELNRVVRVVSIIAVGAGGGLFAVAVLLGLPPTEGFLFGLGVMVALVPEGLLPTVTLSLARAAQRMAGRQALVRRLEAVETLGATTYICTDKTGTLTRNEMSVVRVWTPGGDLALESHGYDPTVPAPGTPATGAPTTGPSATSPLVEAAALAAASAARCVHGHAVEHPDGRWVAEGDPMEAALDVAARRLASPATGHPDAGQVVRRLPYTADRRRSSVVVREGDGTLVLHVLGAPEAVLAVANDPDATSTAASRLEEMARDGLRVVATARRTVAPSDLGAPAVALEADLELLGLLGLQDPPRDDVGTAIAACRGAGIRLAMVTGDHPATAAAVATEVGLLGPGGLVVTGDHLPADSRRLAALLDRPDGVVVARVSPEDKLRIATALRDSGHVVAMTGDGVNDAPALRAADVGVAMGASGSDVAREAADLVLLDDHFATIVGAVELGRATFTNIRRSLTYHLTDNVAELTPFAAWALTGGQLPLAIGVLQVLALDIGTDMLPALALGAEPPSSRTLTGPAPRRRLVDRALLARVFGVLGPAEAVGSMATFVAVLLAGGWRWGEVPSGTLLALASGSAFAAIAVAQLANAVACRSTALPAWRSRLRGNRLIVVALAAEVVLLVVFLAVPPLARVLGGSWPAALGWTGAVVTAALVVLADAAAKRFGRRRSGRGLAGPAALGPAPFGPPAIPS